MYIWKWIPREHFLGKERGKSQDRYRYMYIWKWIPREHFLGKERGLQIALLLVCRFLGGWGFRGPGFRSARQVLCGDASRLFSMTSKRLSGVMGRTELCHKARNPGPQKPQTNCKKKQPFGTVWFLSVLWLSPIFSGLLWIFRFPLPWPSNPCFFGNSKGFSAKKQGFFLFAEPLKSLEKEGKRKKKQGKSENEKSKEIEKSKDWRVRVLGFLNPARKLQSTWTFWAGR